jgi:hypothetical protein
MVAGLTAVKVTISSRLRFNVVTVLISAMGITNQRPTVRWADGGRRPTPTAIRPADLMKRDKNPPSIGGLLRKLLWWRKKSSGGLAG